MSRTAPLKRALANSSGVATRFSNWNWTNWIFLFFNKILFQFYRRKKKGKGLLRVHDFLIIARRQHFFQAEKIQPTIYTRSSQLLQHRSAHSCPHKRGITSVYPVQCLSVYLCPRLTPDPSRQTAQSRARKRGLCR